MRDRKLCDSRIFLYLNIWLLYDYTRYPRWIFLYSSHKTVSDRSLHSESRVMTHLPTRRTHCINSGQRDGAAPPSSPTSVRGRASVAARQLITFWQIAEPVVLLVTSKTPAGPCRVLAGRLFLREAAPSSVWIKQEGSRGICEGGGSRETEETRDYGVY